MKEKRKKRKKGTVKRVPRGKNPQSETQKIVSRHEPFTFKLPPVNESTIYNV